MKLETRHFGEIEIERGKVVAFEGGLPGFEEHTKFVLLTDVGGGDDNSLSGLTFMQSVTDRDVCFILVDATEIFPDYNPVVETEELEGLGEYESDGFTIYNIARFPENVREATVNLKAPIVINERLMTGRQVVCQNEEYSVRQKLFAETD